MKKDVIINFLVNQNTIQRYAELIKDLSSVLMHNSPMDRDENDFNQKLNTIDSSFQSVGILCRTIIVEEHTKIEKFLISDYHNIFIVFVDEHFIYEFHDKKNQFDSDKMSIIWLSCSDSASEYIGLSQFITAKYLDKTDINKREYDTTLNSIIYALAREISKEFYNKKNDEFKLTIFVSHTKSDGVEKVEKLKNYFQSVHSYGRSSTFVDYVSMDFGQNGLDIMRSSMEECTAAVIILTNNFSDRAWCITELLKFKERLIPYVIVSAIDVQGILYPYIGNAPIIDYNHPDSLHLIEKTLNLEIIRFYYHKLKGDYIKNAYSEGNEMTVVCRKIEAFDILRINGNLLYPDPAARVMEMDYYKSNKDRIFSYTQLIASKHYLNKTLLRNKVLLSSGTIQQHSTIYFPQNIVQFIIEKISYALFLIEFKVGYGGHIKKDNIAMEIARQSQRFIKSSTNHLDNKQVNQKLFIHFISDDVEKSPEFKKVFSEYHNYVDYVLTKKDIGLEFRRSMINDFDIIVAIGGDISKSSNETFQGTIQEVLYAIYQNKKVILIGGFGGSVKDFMNHIKVNELNPDFERKFTNFCEEYDIKDFTIKNVRDYINNMYSDNELSKILLDSICITEITEAIYRLLNVWK